MNKGKATILSSIYGKRFFNDPVADPVADPNADPKPNIKTFTQDQVNDMMKETKRQLQVKNQELIGQLEQQRGLASTSEDMRKEIEGKIEALRNETLTQEENYKRQIKTWETKYNSDIDKHKGETKVWQDRYTNAVIGRSIVDSATEFKAFSPSQIEALLRPSTKLEEALDANGKPTGDFVPKVTFEDIDTENKPIKVSLTINQAVKRMTELPNKYGNLFKTDANGGPNLNNNDSSSTGTAYTENMSMEAYMKGRSKILSQIK